MDEKVTMVWNRILYVLEWFVGQDTSLENPVNSGGNTVGIVRQMFIFIYIVQQMYVKYLYLK